MWEYEDARVKITDVDGQVFTGIVDHYTSELDDPDGIESLSLEPDGRNDILINFTEAEIAGIEVIDAEVHEMAQVV